MASLFVSPLYSWHEKNGRFVVHPGGKKGMRNRFLVAFRLIVMVMVGSAVFALPRALAQAPAAPNVNALLSKLTNKDPNVRASAAEALGKLGKGAVPAVNALTRTLKDKNPSVRLSAVLALRKLGPIAAPAVSALAGAFTDPDPDVRQHAVFALGRLGTIAAPAVNSLIKALRDTNPSVRRNAVWALGRIESVATSTIDALIEMLRDKEPQVRTAAAQALAEISSVEARDAPHKKENALKGAIDNAARVESAITPLLSDSELDPTRIQIAFATVQQARSTLENQSRLRQH
jgi:HEAT repeat protein